MATPDFLQDYAKDYAAQAKGAYSVPIDTTQFTGRQFVAGEDPLQTQAIGIAQGGVGAYDLLEQLKITETGAKPATIYRALDFLAELGFIHKIESTNAFMLCHHFDHIHPVQLLICDTCGFVKELHSSVISHELNNLAAEGGFVVSGQTIEAHGKCESCRAS